jgi:hypothetical protein
MGVTPTFSTEEAETLINLLEKSDVPNKRDLIAKIQTTPGYLKYAGILNDVKVIWDTKLKGYHLTDIPKGEYGQLSKVIEEALELKDAMEQGQKIMCLVELSDVLGAIEGYLENHYGDMVTVTDLFNMAAATKRAFETGQRK